MLAQHVPEMEPDELIRRLRELQVPHQLVADAIGRDRSVATKLLSGSRRLAAQEIAPLVKLLERQQRTRMKLEPTTTEEDWHAPPAQMLTINGTVQAGAWLEIDPQDQPAVETYPAAPDPRYPARAQWLSRVRGDSMNALTRRGQPAGILDGDLVHVVDAITIDYVPRSGDVVEVERVRFGGREREVTLKQIELLPDGSALLWPRSTNPRWADPVPYREGDEEAVEVRVRAKVIQHIRQY